MELTQGADVNDGFGYESARKGIEVLMCTIYI